TGNLNFLYPEEPGSAAVQAGAVAQVGDLELTPPDGRERVVAIWSRERLPLSELLSLGGVESSVSRRYLATRDIQRIQEALQARAADSWSAEVMELDHRAG